MKKIFFAILITSIILLLGSIGFGCGDTVVNTPVTGSENVTDIQDRGGCILLEIKFKDYTKTMYWVTVYFEENGFLILFNNQGFLIAIDLNGIQDYSETNYCKN